MVWCEALISVFPTLVLQFVQPTTGFQKVKKMGFFFFKKKTFFKAIKSCPFCPAYVMAHDEIVDFSVSRISAKSCCLNFLKKGWWYFQRKPQQHVFFEAPLKFSYSAVMFNQTVFWGLRWERFEASLLKRKKESSDSLDGDFNSPECKITSALPWPWGPF